MSDVPTRTGRPAQGHDGTPDTMDIILKRRSVRRYLPDPIPPEIRTKLLEAMLRAPTAGNQMLYSVIDVEDPAIKADLAESCDHQPFIATAPWVLVFLADVQRMYDFFQASGVKELIEEGKASRALPREADLFLAACDALIAAQTLVIAAESIGLGSCYIGDIMENYEFHRGLFDLPPYTFPITMLALGYPTDPQRNRRLTDRIPAEHIVFTDRYRHLGRHDLRHLYDHNIGRSGAYLPGAGNFGQHSYLRKFSADFMEEMRRSVGEMLRNWQQPSHPGEH